MAQLEAPKQEVNTEINLEKVLLIEDKIWTLLEVHRFLERVVRETNTKKHHFAPEEESKNAVCQIRLQEVLTNEEFASKLSEVAFLCDEWWEVTHENSINNLEKVFKHD